MAPVVLRIQQKEINANFRIDIRKNILEMCPIKHLFILKTLLSCYFMGEDFSDYFLISLSLCLGNSNSPSGQLLLPQGAIPDP